MKLKFDESKIQYWADRNKPWGRIAELESEFLTLKPEVQKRSYYTKSHIGNLGDVPLLLNETMTIT